MALTIQEKGTLYDLFNKVHDNVEEVLNFKVLGQKLTSIARVKDGWSNQNSVSEGQQDKAAQADSFVLNFNLFQPQLEIINGFHRQTEEIKQQGYQPKNRLPDEFFTVSIGTALQELSRIITTLQSNQFINGKAISSDFFDYLVADFGGVIQPLGDGGRKDLNELFGLIFDLNDIETGGISEYLSVAGQRFYNIPDIRPSSNTAAKGDTVFFSDLDLERSIFGASAPPAYYIGAMLQPSMSPEGQAQNDPLGVFNKYKRAAPYVPCRYSPHEDERDTDPTTDLLHTLGWDSPVYGHLSDLSVAEKGIVVLSSNLPTGPDPNRPRPSVVPVAENEIFENDGVEFVLGQQVFITEIIESSTGTWVGFIPFPDIGFPELRIKDLTRNYTKVLYTKPEYIRKAESAASIDPDPPIKYLPNSRFSAKRMHFNDPEFIDSFGKSIEDNGFIVDDAITQDWLNLKDMEVKLKYFNFNLYNKVEAETLEKAVEITPSTADSDPKKKFSEGYFYFVVGKGRRSAPVPPTTGKELRAEFRGAVLRVASEEAAANAFNNLLLYLGKDTKETRQLQVLKRRYLAPVSSRLIASGPIKGEQKVLFAFPAAIAEALPDSKAPYYKNFPDNSPFLNGRDYVISLESKYFTKKENGIPEFIENIVNVFENKFKYQVEKFQEQGTILDPNGIKYDIEAQIENFKRFPQALYDFFERQYLGSSAEHDQLNKIIANAFAPQPAGSEPYEHKIEIGIKDNGEIGEAARLTISYVLFIPDEIALKIIIADDVKGISDLPFIDFYSVDERKSTKRSAVVLKRGIHLLRNEIAGLENSVAPVVPEDIDENQLSAYETQVARLANKLNKSQANPVAASVASSRTLNYLMFSDKIVKYSDGAEDDDANLWTQKLAELSVPPMSIYFTKKTELVVEEIDCAQLYEEAFGKSVAPGQANDPDVAAKRKKFMSSAKCKEYYFKLNSKPTPATGAQLSRFSIQEKLRSIKNPKGNDAVSQAFITIYDNVLANLDPQGIMGLLFACFQHKFGIPLTAEALCEYAITKLIELDPLGFKKALIAADPSLAALLGLNPFEGIENTLDENLQAIQAISGTEGIIDPATGEPIKLKDAYELNEKFNNAPIATAMVIRSDDPLLGPVILPLIGDPRIILAIKSLERNNVPVELVPGPKGFSDDPDELISFGEWTWAEIEVERKRLLSLGHSPKEAEAELVRSGYLIPSPEQYEPLLSDDSVLEDVSNLINKFKRTLASAGRSTAIRSTTAADSAALGFDKASDFVAYIKRVTNLQQLCQVLVKPIMDLPGNLLKKNGNGLFESSYWEDWAKNIQKQVDPGNLFKFDLPDNLPTSKGMGDYGKQVLNAFLTMIGTVLGQILNVVLIDYLERCFEEEDPRSAGTPLDAGLGSELLPSLPALTAPLVAGVATPDILAAIRGLIDSFNSKSQLCSLLQGEASDKLLNRCVEYIRQNHASVYDGGLNTPENIKNSFIQLGEGIDLEICNIIEAADQAINDDVCAKINYDVEGAIQHLVDAGLSREEAEEQHLKELEGLKKKIFDIAEFLFPGSNLLEGKLPKLCGPNGIYNVPPAIKKSMERVVDNMLINTKGSLLIDMADLKFLSLPPRAALAVSDPESMAQLIDSFSDPEPYTQLCFAYVGPGIRFPATLPADIYEAANGSGFFIEYDNMINYQLCYNGFIHYNMIHKQSLADDTKDAIEVIKSSVQQQLQQAQIEFAAESVESQASVESQYSSDQGFVIQGPVNQEDTTFTFDNFELLFKFKEGEVEDPLLQGFETDTLDYIFDIATITARGHERSREVYYESMTSRGDNKPKKIKSLLFDGAPIFDFEFKHLGSQGGGGPSYGPGGSAIQLPTPEVYDINDVTFRLSDDNLISIEAAIEYEDISPEIAGTYAEEVRKVCQGDIFTGTPTFKNPSYIFSREQIQPVTVANLIKSLPPEVSWSNIDGNFGFSGGSNSSGGDGSLHSVILGTEYRNLSKFAKKYQNKYDGLSKALSLSSATAVSSVFSNVNQAQAQALNEIDKKLSAQRVEVGVDDFVYTTDMLIDAASPGFRSKVSLTKADDAVTKGGSNLASAVSVAPGLAASPGAYHVHSKFMNQFINSLQASSNLGQKRLGENLPTLNRDSPWSKNYYKLTDTLRDIYPERNFWYGMLMFYTGLDFTYGLESPLGGDGLIKTAQELGGEEQTMTLLEVLSKRESLKEKDLKGEELALHKFNIYDLINPADDEGEDFNIFDLKPEGKDKDNFTSYIKTIEFYRASPGLREIIDHPTYVDNKFHNIIDTFMNFTLAEASGLQPDRIKAIFPNLEKVVNSIEGVFLTCVESLHTFAITSETLVTNSWLNEPSTKVYALPTISLVPLAIVFKRGFRNPDKPWNQDEQIVLDTYSMAGDPVSRELKQSLEENYEFPQYMSYEPGKYFENIARKLNGATPFTPNSYPTFNPNSYSFKTPVKNVSAADFSFKDTTQNLSDSFKQLSLQFAEQQTESLSDLTTDDVSALNSVINQIQFSTNPEVLYYQHCRENSVSLEDVLKNEYFFGIVKLNRDKSYPPNVVVDDTHYYDEQMASDISPASTFFNSISEPLDSDLISILDEIYSETPDTVKDINSFIADTLNSQSLAGVKNKNVIYHWMNALYEISPSFQNTQDLYNNLFENIPKDVFGFTPGGRVAGSTALISLSSPEFYDGAPENIKAKIFGRFLTHKFKKELKRTGADLSNKDMFLKKLEYNLSSHNYSAMNFAYINQAFARLKNSRLNNRSMLRKVWDIILKTPNSPKIDPECQKIIENFNLTSAQSLKDTETDFFNVEEVRQIIMTLFEQSSCQDVYGPNTEENESVTNSMLLGVSILLIKIYCLEACFSSMLAWDVFNISDVFRSRLMKGFILNNMKEDLGPDLYQKLSSLSTRTLAIIQETNEANIKQKYLNKSSLHVLIELEGQKISNTIESIFYNNRPITTDINLLTLSTGQEDFIQAYQNFYNNEISASLEAALYKTLAEPAENAVNGEGVSQPSYAHVIDAYFDNNIYTLNFSSPHKNQGKSVYDVSYLLADPLAGGTGGSVFTDPWGSNAETGAGAAPGSLNYDPIKYDNVAELRALQDDPDYYGFITPSVIRKQKQYLHSLPITTPYNYNIGDLSSFSGVNEDFENDFLKHYDAVDDILDFHPYGESADNIVITRYLTDLSRQIKGAHPFDKENIHEITFGDETTLYLGNFVFQPFVFIEEQDNLDQFQAVLFTHPQTGVPCDSSIGKQDIINASEHLPILEDYRDGANKFQCTIRDYVPLSVWSDFYSNVFLPHVESDDKLLILFEQFGLAPFFKSIEIGIRMSYATPNADTVENLNLVENINDMYPTPESKKQAIKNKALIQPRNYVIANPKITQQTFVGGVPVQTNRVLTMADKVCNEMHIPIVERKAKLVFEKGHFLFDGDPGNKRSYSELGVSPPEKNSLEVIRNNNLEEIFSDFNPITQRYLASIANNFSQFFYKNVAKDAFNAVKNSSEFKFLFQYLLPMEDYMAMAFLYTRSTISPFISDPKIILEETKNSLKQSFQLLTESNRYDYQPNPIANFLIDEINSQDADTRGKGPNLEKKILRILLRTPLLILKGFVETTDLAIIIAKTIIDIANTIQMTVIGSIEAVLRGIKMATDGAKQQAENTKTQATVQANVSLSIARQTKQQAATILENMPPEKLEGVDPENIVKLDTEGKEKVKDWEIEDNIPAALKEDEEQGEFFQGLSDLVSSLKEVVDTVAELEETIDDLQEKSDKIQEELKNVVEEAKKIMKDLFSSPYLLPSVWASLLPTITPVGMGGIIPPPLYIGPPSTIPGMIYLALLFIDDHEERMHALSQTVGDTDAVDCGENII